MLGFIVESVRINNKVQFALVCVGVVLIAVILQFLHRVCRTYDRIIIRNREGSGCHGSNRSDAVSVSNLPGFFVLNNTSWSGEPNSASVGEQVVRTTLYTLVWTTSYLTLGMALSFNGYVIVCILLGAWIGNFVFGRDSLMSVGYVHTAALLNHSN
jgi:copper transporter 1